MIKIVARHYRVQPARRASSQQIYERRVLNPDNNHLSGTITRCINRVLSPDTNDKRRSVSLSPSPPSPFSLSLRPLDITAIVLSKPLSFVPSNERIGLQALPLLFFSNEIFDRYRIYLSIYLTKKIFRRRHLFLFDPLFVLRET